MHEKIHADGCYMGTYLYYKHHRYLVTGSKFKNSEQMFFCDLKTTVQNFNSGAIKEQCST